MSRTLEAKIYLALEESEVKWKEGVQEKWELMGEVGDYEEGVITRIINYDSQDTHHCGIELESVEWGCKTIYPAKVARLISKARKTLSTHVNNPEDFKLTLSAEYF